MSCYVMLCYSVMVSCGVCVYGLHECIVCITVCVYILIQLDSNWFGLVWFGRMQKGEKKSYVNRQE